MAKKMMLIDANFVGGNDLRSTKKHYSTLDQNVSNVLERTDLSDSDKLKLYQHALSRFLIGKQEAEGEAGKPVAVQTIAADKQKKFEESYLESLPADEREKASGVIDDIVAYSPLRWNDKGELVVDRRVVKGSSLDKLVTHELKQQKTPTSTATAFRKAKTTAPSTPVGWDTFSKYIRRPAALSSVTPRWSKRNRKASSRIDWLSYD